MYSIAAPNVPTIQSVQGYYDETTRLIWLNLKWAQQVVCYVWLRVSTSLHFESFYYNLN